MIDAASDSVFCFLLQCVVWVCEHWLYICDCREKFIRLQHENKMLRVQQEEYERENITALQLQLEEAHKTRSELDTENRWTEPISPPRSPTDWWDGASLLFSSVKFYIVLNSFLKCILFFLSDWVESGSLSCSSRSRISRRLCRVRRLNLMMWVCQDHWHQYRENIPQSYCCLAA